LSGALPIQRHALHDRDFLSDRPGRVLDHAPPATGRRGSVAHHATGGERRPRAREGELFARQIAAELENALRQDRFERLVLMAGPAFLGKLRAALPKSLAATVAAQVHKDLAHAADEVIHEHLPREAFKRGAE